MNWRTVFLRGLTAAAAVALAVTVAAGCDGDDTNGGAAARGGGGGEGAGAAPAVTNRIDVPEKVRQNLGITFAKVQRRRVRSTIRVPGRFELLPSARREYRAVLPGRVEILVRQYQPVEAGELLLRLDSPEWRRIQHEAVEAEGEINGAEAQLEVALAAKAETEGAVKIYRRRVGDLAEANVRRAEVEAELALAEGRLPRLEAEIRAKRVGLNEAREHYVSKMNTLASIVGLPVAELLDPVPAGDGTAGAAHAGATPRWRTIDRIDVRAAAAGVVTSPGVPDGSWVEQSTPVLSTVDPRSLRFRASAFQSDLGRLRDGAAAAIVPPPGPAASANGAMAGRVSLGLEASPDTRTVELIVTPEKADDGSDAAWPAGWARAGVSAYAEIVTDDSEDPETAIPLAAVVQDDLERVYFRRDPKNPDKVIRVAGDFGLSDGEWVVVHSGLKAGDEVVLAGVYELKLTGTGKAGGAGGGHFHADGTWHAAGTPEPGGK
jgi:hypothetical protein